VLTLAFVFLILAVMAGAFTFVAAGPVGPILFFVFMALFGWSLLLHRRDRSTRDRKTATRATTYTSAWKDADRRRGR
jgi:uncharacterized membrane protein YtjA (UPF0391 family)